MTIAIERIQTRIVRIPTRQDFRWNGLDRPLGETFVVEVHSGGVTGYGETVPLPDWGGPGGVPFGETPQIDELVIGDLVAPRLIGLDAADLAAVRAEAGAAVLGYPYAQAALEIACYDLVARTRGVPVHALLGGRRRDAVPIAHMIGIMDIDAGEREAAAALEEGAVAFQIKGGQDVEKDVALVRRLRELGGPDLTLRLDANCGYGAWKPALAGVEALADAGADLVEQPSAHADDLRRITARSPIPIIADEACWSPADALALVRTEAVDVLSVYIAKAGGMRGAADVTRIAAAARLPHDLNGSLEAGIGNAANLQIAAASAAELLPCVIPVNGPASDPPSQVLGRYFADDVISRKMELRDGHVVVGDEPGLGIEVDEEKLEAMTIRRRTTGERVSEEVSA